MQNVVAMELYFPDLIFYFKYCKLSIQNCYKMIPLVFKEIKEVFQQIFKIDRKHLEEIFDEFQQNCINLVIR